MDLDSQSIEKRDFPVVRRGYEPAAVDAHLHTIAAAVAQLSTSERGGESVGAAAATQVQGIIDAAEAAAAQILSEAQAQAAQTTKEAELAAQSTRDAAIARSQAHVAAVEQAATALRSRVEAMDADLRALVDTLRAGSTRLAQQLGDMGREMGALYDSAGGPAIALREPEPVVDQEIAPRASDNGASVAKETLAQPAPAAATSTDIDSARLIALNMALNGDPPAETERYLAEHFELPDREQLVAEVYAAIEG